MTIEEAKKEIKRLEKLIKQQTRAKFGRITYSYEGSRRYKQHVVRIERAYSSDGQYASLIHDVSIDKVIENLDAYIKDMTDARDYLIELQREGADE